MANEPSSTSNFVQIEDKVINKVADASVTSDDISLTDSVFIFKKTSDGKIDKVVNSTVQWLIDEFGKDAVQAKLDAISAKDDAKTSETNAKSSETSALASATKASTSEANAKESETKALASETNAKASETNAKASEASTKAYKEQAQSLLEQADLNLIESIEQTTTSTVSSGKNVITITQKDGTKSTFDVYNGAKGETATVQQASPTVAGIMKLFSSLGQDTDGAPTSKAVQDAISAISGLPLINADGIKLKIDMQKVSRQIKSNSYSDMAISFKQPFQTNDYVIVGVPQLNGFTVKVFQLVASSTTRGVWYYETYSGSDITAELTVLNLAIGY